VLLAIALAAGCGSRDTRPSVLTGAGAPATTATPPPAPPAETGPDISRLDEEGALGTDVYDADALSEGGPLADVRFELDSSALSEAARQTLAGHAAWLKSHPSARITVEGHCDERGTVDYNLALGEQRARAVREYLVDLGISPGRLRTLSFGKEKPLDPASNEAAWAVNRRAHFVVAGR
jgi:peptidoglycan-associated lipoprotein